MGRPSGSPGVGPSRTGLRGKRRWAGGSRHGDRPEIIAWGGACLWMQEGRMGMKQ